MMKAGPKARTRSVSNAAKPKAQTALQDLQASFPSHLLREVEDVRKRFNLPTPQAAFPYWVCHELLEATEAETVDACGAEGGNDKGIDFLLIDRDESRAIIGQTKFSADLNVNVRESHANSVLSSLQWLRSPSLLREEGKPELAQIAEEYLEVVESGFTTEIWFIYTSPKKPNIDRLILAFNAEKERQGEAVRAYHIHLDALRDQWGDLNYLPARIPSEEFCPLGGKYFEQSGGFGRSVVFSIKGSDLKALHDRHTDKLFERNVRLYLGAKKGSVNSGIEETLKSGGEAGNFWAYNNGIAIIADSYDIMEKDGELKISALNISIINGCQTTVSISRHLPDGQDVSVLARIICAHKGIIDNVIKYNNSQNQVKAWDIATQDIVQRRLREEFELLKNPYIYITRRGTRPKGNLKQFRDNSGKLRLLRFDEVGQYIAAYRGHPLLAYKAKPEIFGSQSREVFHNNITAVEALFYWKAAQAVSAAIADLIGKEDINKFPLRRGGKIFVLWVVGFIFSWRNGDNYLAHLTEERVTGKPIEAALAKYASFSADLYASAFTHVASQGGGEVNRLNWSQKFLDEVKTQIQIELRKWNLAPKYLNEVLPIVFERAK